MGQRGFVIDFFKPAVAKNQSVHKSITLAHDNVFPGIDLTELQKTPSILCKRNTFKRVRSTVSKVFCRAINAVNVSFLLDDIRASAGINSFK